MDVSRGGKMFRFVKGLMILFLVVGGQAVSAQSTGTVSASGTCTDVKACEDFIAKGQVMVEKICGKTHLAPGGSFWGGGEGQYGWSFFFTYERCKDAKNGSCDSNRFKFIKQNLPGAGIANVCLLNASEKSCFECPLGTFDNVNCVIGTDKDLAKLSLKLDARYWWDDKYKGLYRAATNKKCAEGTFDGVNCLVKTEKDFHAQHLHYFSTGAWWYDPKYKGIYNTANKCK